MMMAGFGILSGIAIDSVCDGECFYLVGEGWRGDGFWVRGFGRIGYFERLMGYAK
jgi:hypothetical protein